MLIFYLKRFPVNPNGIPLHESFYIVAKGNMLGILIYKGQYFYTDDIHLIMAEFSNQ